MELSTEPLIYGLVFAGVLALVEGLYLTVFGRSISLNRRVNRRLDMLEKGADRAEVLQQLRKEMSQHMSSAGIPFYGLLAKKAQMANIAFTPRQLVLIMALLAGLAFVALTVGTSAALPVRVALGLGMGVGGVYFWVGSKAKKRLNMIEEQLPEGIEMIVRSLRVGHPFSSAISVAAREMADPLATEFGIIADEAAYGREVAESLRDLAERMDMQDMRFLAIAVAIQQKAGGNLAEILEGRFKLFRRVKAITAEAKWSGMFLSGFPFAALGMVLLLKPTYYDEVKETALFMPATLFVFVMLGINIVFMRMMTNIKV